MNDFNVDDWTLAVSRKKRGKRDQEEYKDEGTAPVKETEPAQVQSEPEVVEEPAVEAATEPVPEAKEQRPKREKKSPKKEKVCFRSLR